MAQQQDWFSTNAPKPSTDPQADWFATNAPASSPTADTPPPPTPPKMGPAPGLGWQILRATVPAVGAVLGAAGGATVGAPAGPPGIFFGSVAGAGAGAAAGESIEVALESLWHKLTGNLQPVSPSGAARRVVGATNTGMMAEAAGPVITKGVTKAAAPFATKMAPYAKDAIETFRNARGRSLVLPAEVSESGVLGFAHNIAEGGIGSRGTIQDVQNARQGLAEQRVIDVLDRLGPRVTAKTAGETVRRGLPASAAEEAQATLRATATGTEPITAAAAGVNTARSQGASTVGELVRGVGPLATTRSAGQAVTTARNAAIQVFRKQEKIAWGKFEAQGAGIPVTTPKLDAFVSALQRKEAGAILPNAGLTAAQRVAQLTGGAEEAIPVIGGSKTAFKQLPQSVQEALMVEGDFGSPQLTATQFQRTVSNLKTLVRSLERSAKTDPSKYNGQLGLAKRVLGLAEDDLRASIANSPAAEAYDEATSLSRVGNQQLFNEEIRRTVKQAPSKVTDTLLKPNNSTAIQMTRGAVGSDAMRGVQSVALQKITRPDPATGQIQWTRVLRELQRLGPDTLDSLFPQGEANGLRRVALGIVDAERRMKALVDAHALATAAARDAAATAREAPDPFTVVRAARQPEKIPGILFRRDNVSAVNAVRSAIGEPAFQSVRRVALDEVLHPDPVTGRIEWGAVLTRLDAVDPETLRAFFPEGHAQEVQRIARLMSSLDRTHVGGAGRVGIMLTQFGAVAAAASGRFPQSAGTILLGPAALSKIMSSRVGLKWLSEGLQAPTGSPQAINAAAQLVGFLSRDPQQEHGDQPK